MAGPSDSSGIFNNLSAKISQLLYGPTKDTRILLNKTLNELNSINYRYPVVTNATKAVLLVNQCCSLIPPEDTELVLKCCQLITNLLTRQNVVIEGRTQIMAGQWCLQGLRQQQTDADILAALEALLRANTKHELIVEIVRNEILINSAKDGKNPEIGVFALQCLEACTHPPEDLKSSLSEKFPGQFRVCFDVFLHNLLNHKPGSDEKLVNIKVVSVCLRGLQNIIVQQPDLLHDNLGIILGSIKSYMLYNLKQIEFVEPQKLLPSTLSIPEPSPNITREKKGGKMAKQRKQKTQPSAMNQADNWGGDNKSYIPANNLMCPSENIGGQNRGGLKTSDSDFSDTEGGNLTKTAGILSGRVRQAALNLFLNVVKITPKKVMFSYWSSFIPENQHSGCHNLMTCILKDTSARARMAALNVLLLLLTTSKLYLAQAEKGESLSFTPFSTAIGLTITELHRCLHLALYENSVLVLIQILKCFAALVQATPYHRLSTGLLTKIIRNIKPFTSHKDPTVQVTALIILGCILASEPICPETKNALLKTNLKTDQTQPLLVENHSEKNVEFVDFSSSEEEEDVNSSSLEISWLLQKCLSNLGVGTNSNLIENNPTQVAVKLESLQIISVMSRNYFEDLLGPHLNLVTKALDLSLAEKYTNIRLHAARAVDFIGQAMNRSSVTSEKSVQFWQTLLGGNLPGLLQQEEHPGLRAAGCDCFGSIGATQFEQLPRERQILFVTLLFSCSRDVETTVVGAAVRSLAICVMYPSLREDMGFVIDTAEAILRVLHDENLIVRVKSSWALGNLSDALVMNKSMSSQMEELPQNFILKLLKASIGSSKDNDRIKMNTVRALGNFLQLIDEDLINDERFKEGAIQGFENLAKNSSSGSNMKVRWNSCYALGNAMRNPVLFGVKQWQEKVFGVLMELVVNFKNFKVRINAAVALAAPSKRELYGEFYLRVWEVLGKALETAQNMEDFNEYKHRDHLVEQICLSLGHLIKLLIKEDLLSIGNSLNFDVLKVQMKKVWERLLPEKSTPLFEAHTYITTLINDPSLTTEQKSIAKNLQMILKQDY